jgi:hypothetical protein
MNWYKQSKMYNGISIEQVVNECASQGLSVALMKEPESIFDNPEVVDETIDPRKYPGMTVSRIGNGAFVVRENNYTDKNWYIKIYPMQAQKIAGSENRFRGGNFGLLQNLVGSFKGHERLRQELEILGLKPIDTVGKDGQPALKVSVGGKMYQIENLNNPIINELV